MHSLFPRNLNSEQMHLLKKILTEWPSVGMGSIVKMWIGACHCATQSSSKLPTSHSINTPSRLGLPCPSPLRPCGCHPPPTLPSLTCWLGTLPSTIPTPCFWTFCSLCLEMLSPSWRSSPHSTTPSICHHFFFLPSLALVTISHTLYFFCRSYCLPRECKVWWAGFFVLFRQWKNEWRHLDRPMERGQC